MLSKEWLQEIHSSPIGAETATLAKDPDGAQSILKIKRDGERRIDHAYARGDIDYQYLAIMYTDSIRFLMEAAALKENEPLIIRPRTLQEVFREFPQKLNDNHTRNIPVGVSAKILPKPLYLDVGPFQQIAKPSGPLIVAAEVRQQDTFIQTIEQANQQLNARRIRVFKNPTGAELQQLCNTPLPRSIIVAQAETIPPHDLQEIMELSSRIPYHQVIITFPPDSRLNLSPTLLFPPNAPYFIRNESGARQERYFPIKMNS